MRRLLDAAMICFDERGYYDTRVNDVVKIAKTSHGTFYLYFSNKEDLLRALVAEAGTAAQYLADTLNRPPESGGTPQWEDVRGWVAVYSDLWIRYAALFRAWTDLARIDPELHRASFAQTFTVMSDALARQISPDRRRSQRSTRRPPPWRFWPCWTGSTTYGDSCANRSTTWRWTRWRPWCIEPCSTSRGAPVQAHADLDHAACRDANRGRRAAAWDADRKAAARPTAEAAYPRGP